MTRPLASLLIALALVQLALADQVIPPMAWNGIPIRTITDRLVDATHPRRNVDVGPRVWSESINGKTVTVIGSISDNAVFELLALADLHRADVLDSYPESTKWEVTVAGDSDFAKVMYGQDCVGPGGGGDFVFGHSSNGWEFIHVSRLC